jgi:sigma-B regulation protein RsbU (phosphoserine phosphatase)
VPVREKIKALWIRHRRTLYWTAVILQLVHTGGLGIWRRLPLDSVLDGPGVLLNVYSKILVILLIVRGFRWLHRRFLFRVSRRLGLAFFFVGVIPLVVFALLMMAIGSMGVLLLADHTAEAELRECVAEMEGAAAQAVEIIGAQGAAGSGWRPLAATGSEKGSRSVSVWVGGFEGPSSIPLSEPIETLGASAASARDSEPLPVGRPFGAGAPPRWLQEERFSGYVAAGDAIYITASRSGRLRDGRPYLALATCAVDSALTERIESATGLSVSLFDLPAIIDRARERGEAEPDTSGTPGPAPGGGRTELDVSRSDRPRAAIEIETGVESDSALSVSKTISYGDGKITGESYVAAPVVSWLTGDTLTLGPVRRVAAGPLPLFSIEFSATQLLASFFAGTPEGERELWLAARILGGVFLGMMLAAVFVGIALTGSVTRAVDTLHKGTKRIAGGDLDHRMRVRSKDQLGALADSFNEMTDSVKRLLVEKAEKERLEQEMQIAAEVQRSMLPRRFPTIPGLDGAARCIMARHVGGDLYDFIPIGGDRVAIVVGDVSGKGVSAALVMANVISTIRSMAVAPRDGGPCELFRELNRILVDTTAADCFVTLFYAEYSLRTGDLRYVNAGHDWPMVVRPDGQLFIDLESSGLMLGALPDVSLHENEIELEEGDLVVAYSDGLIDAVNERDEPFGRERVRDVLRSLAHLHPDEIADGVERALAEWRGGAEDVDDITILILRRCAIPGVEARTAAAGEARRS